MSDRVPRSKRARWVVGFVAALALLTGAAFLAEFLFALWYEGMPPMLVAGVAVVILAIVAVAMARVRRSAKQ
ncbi:hypothetical protein [Nocardioides panaciterrulae]|uniref:Putative membrane protein n=1 Tax=Nocardioides panaciterrulae TaxID=661492 RepID=A0A7Y9E6K2_9ACTN|nr:hypothetical protein [Nocardioides panaciterrulae]NYD42075.1 putative membrane protein [Nocardioides panaciterrulae]